MRGWWRLVVLLAALGMLRWTGPAGRNGAAQAGQPEGGSASDLARVVFYLDDGETRTMLVEVAATPNVAVCGLGHRFSMPEDHGMLFVEQADSRGAFWNRNTFIPLQLAWIGADGTIRQLLDMAPVPPDVEPQLNTIYSPSVSYRYVVEANQGWFDRNGVRVGDQVDLSEALALVPDLTERPNRCDVRGY